MSVLSRVAALLTDLPPAHTRRVRVDPNLRIPMDDGVTLVADRYYPEAGGDHCPILLNRTPYGRATEGRLGYLFAERGYQVVVVSCRGTFGSGGDWDPFWNEERDGKAVLKWLAEQPWFSGRVGLFGGSYHGLTQWAVAQDAPEFVKAMSALVTASAFGEFMFPGGAFALESALTWTYGLQRQELPQPKPVLALLFGAKHVARGCATLPLSNADQAMGGPRADYYQDWLQHPDPGEPFWARIDFGREPGRVPPAMLMAGWYDIFGPRQIADFARLRAAGREATLCVGPWSHGNLGTVRHALPRMLDWMDRHLREVPAGGTLPRVELFDMGAKRWRYFDEWPPPATAMRFHLHPGGELSAADPPDSAPDRYRYDPADPTPGIGGASLNGKNAGARDNRAVEDRPDVLVYSSQVLTEALSVVGPLTADLHVRSSLAHTDFFVRLCDVAPSGYSKNLSDGILRLHPGNSGQDEDGVMHITIEMCPTANTFLPGHRIRLQVSSGAHPIYARNLGTGDPLATATRMFVADQEVLHDPRRPSALVLPVA